MIASKSPAATPASKPTHGLALPSPNFTSAAYVTAAAAKAPANIFPSSAILITPERSENMPPSAASTNGVANLIVDHTSAMVKMSLIDLNFRSLQQTESANRTTEERFCCDKQNDYSLQNLNNVFCDMFREPVNVNSAVLQNSKQKS